MKTLIKNSLFILALLAVTQSYSNNLVVVSNNKNNEATIIKFEENVEKGSTITIKDNKGEILYKERVKKSGRLTKGFDLRNLPNNDYFFEIEKAEVINVIPFSVEDGKPSIKENEEYTIAKPTITVNNQCVYLSNNSEEGQDFDINVYFEGSDLAYQESLNDVKNISRTYDFSGSQRGTYRVVVTTEGRKFENNINVR